jgi:iron-sulfur cluster assembly accessory protein
MVTLTEAATTKIREMLGQQAEAVAGVRVFVQPSDGCSGFAYGMAFAEKVEEGDWVGDFGGVTILVDPQSAPLLNGINIDYVESVQASGFKIHNPNAVRTCGCGSSFDTAESAAQGRPMHGTDEHGHGGHGA